MPNSKFKKPFIPNPSILDAIPKDPLGYVSNDGVWAAVPWGKKYVILHNGRQVHTSNNLKSAKSYISKSSKATKKTSSSLENFL
jgi:hypothetical protein|tara:strand:+ start:279 stop:530 length:252 start_codon:yes stop_codon:yes gene_type:complete